MSLKHAQWDLAQRLERNGQSQFHGSTHLMNFSYSNPVHFYTIANTIRATVAQHEPSETEDRFERFYKSIKPSFSQHSSDLEFVQSQKGAQAEFYWREFEEGKCLRFIYRPLKSFGEDKSRIIEFEVGSNEILLNTPPDFPSSLLSFIFLVISVILLLLLLHALVGKLIRRIFFAGSTDNRSPDTNETSLKSTIPAQENIFLYGPAGSGKHQTVLKYVQDFDVAYKELDLSRLSKEDVAGVINSVRFSDSVAERKKIVILTHLDANSADAAVTEKKLELIEKVLNENHQVIILSSRSFVELPLKEYNAGTDSYKNFTDRWTNIFSRFYTIYHRWEHPEEAGSNNKIYSLQFYKEIAAKIPDRLFNTTPEKSFGKYLEEKCELLVKNITEECNHSEFLWKLRDPMLTYLYDSRNNFLPKEMYELETTAAAKYRINQTLNSMFEFVCAKIESLAWNYYLSTWNTLSREEQMTLYDIALDDLVNPANRDIANRLAELGLVRKVQGLACFYVMNHSFSNFIFKHVNKNEIKSFRHEVAEKGFWRSFQLPLIILILAAGIFIFLTQRDAFNNFLLYLGGAITGITGLVRLLAIVPQKSQGS
jgi:hypothetical protein